MKRSTRNRRVRLSNRQVQRTTFKAKLIIGGSSAMLLCGIIFLILDLVGTKSASASTMSSATLTRTSFSTVSTTSGPQTTWNHTNVSGSNQILLVGVTTQDKPVSFVKYNNASLTLAGTITKNLMTTNLYYMKNPPVGTYQMKVSTNGATEMYAGADIFDGIDLTAAISVYTNSGLNNAPTTGNIGSPSSQFLYSVVGTIAKLPTPQSSSTGVHSLGSAFYNAAAYITGGAAAANRFSMASADNWGVVSILITPTVALPVTWKNFTLKREGANVKATWVTASEINNDYFILQRSTDGIQFTDISKVQGAGNTTYDSQYNSNDETDIYSSYYYRVKQVDYDGKYAYSEIEFMKGKKMEEPLLVYPTVVNDHVNFKMASINEQENYKIKILDSSGKLIVEKNIQGSDLLNSSELNTEEFISGTYFVVLENSIEVVSKGRFIKS